MKKVSMIYLMLSLTVPASVLNLEDLRVCFFIIINLAVAVAVAYHFNKKEFNGR